MDHISGCSQVYLSKKGGDELFEGLKAPITQKKVTLFLSSFAFQNCGLYSLFSFHGSASGQKSMDAGDIQLYGQLASHKKGIYLLEI